MTSAAAVNPFPMPRQAPPGWAYLDYPRADILLQATTSWEKKMRAGACAKEPWTVAWIESMAPGSCLWNVGANVGSYALLAAKLGHAVVAIEPSYASYAALCNNILANCLEGRITPLCAGLCEGVGIVPLTYRSTEAGAASHAFASQSPQKSAGTMATLALSMDMLAQIGLPKPTHILIDVDGAEPAVLAGGPVLLSEYGPSIMIEVQHEAAESIGGILTSWGYREAERFTMRDNRPLGGLWYARWERSA